MRRGHIGYVLILLLTVTTVFWLDGRPLKAGAQGTPVRPASVDFERDIRPLFLARCAGCHGAERQKGGLRLDQRESALRGGASGPVIRPGDGAGSELIRRVTSREAAEQMPPTGERLTAREVALVRVWIDAGAAWPAEAAASANAGEARRADKATWWSLQPLAAVAPPSGPAIPAEWAKSPIDRFVYAGLTAKGLKPSPPADRRTLIRRLYYALTGLPPTPGEVAEFVADTDPRAWEKLVDRLLASPHYGEQWGRHWLDVARFGESKGFEQNHIINNLWAYRDYVIRAFNEDKPYDRFVIEQLAGDVVGAGRPEVEIGTAFLVCGPYDSVGNQDEIQQKVIRANTIDDLITATSNTFLGLTVNCARCHHHKFDPIPTEDYYRLRATFDGVTHAERIVATPEARAAHAARLEPLEAERKRIGVEIETLEKAISARALDLANREGRWTLPRATRHFNEHRFAPALATQLRFRIRATSDRPKSGENARLDEFEVWTAGEKPRNIALAAAGTRASGPTTRRAEDVVGATTYGVELVNDGRFGERWFVGSPAELTLTFARSDKPELIERIVFSQDRTVDPGLDAKHLGSFVTEYEVEVSVDGKTWRRVADSLAREPYNEAQKVERFAARVTTDAEAAQLSTLRAVRARLEREIKAIPPLPLHWAGKFVEPKEPTYVHRGGDPQRRGGDVPPASLAVLDGVWSGYQLAVDAPEGERRLALARWLVDDRNPLTPRVMANRLWHYHFGAGIVDTPSDFGYLGGRPTHPELLDWLARRLKEHGWRIKPLQREILLSQTWQQASDLRADAARVDGGSRLLWRFPPRRLDAEEIRDTMLHVAGQLDLKPGGPGFRLYRYLEDNVATYVPLDRHGPETWRRAVYHQNARASLIDGLTDFDLPDNASTAPTRVRTISPLQSLTQLNHQLTLDLAEALFARLRREAPLSTDDQIRHAFSLAFQRLPAPGEEAAARQLIAAYGMRAFTRALLNANELFFLR
ncbi:MAG: PSD1 and planctomycete cytochrome C domain-containing protein [Acidobacteriota bacterium]